MNMDILNEYKANMQTSLKNHKALLESLDNLLLGQGHIVCYVNNGSVMAIGYELTELLEVEKCYPTTIGKATRWTKATAEKLAEATKNGAGERPVAMHIREALELDISNLTNLLAELESA